ncbi:MAG: hypothetical protein IT317_19990 [Anaerolineales bacterium]|nr:hypothetical protein [Anaerolineales bacterium]
MTTPLPPTPASPARFVRRVLFKAALLFVALNLLFVAASPMPLLGRLTLYNTVLPGRLRLPYGTDPAKAYNLSLYNLEAMFASQALARPKSAGEYRVLLVGDSSVWGYLLPAHQTLAAQLNDLHLTTADGRRVVAYNLGYPILSLTKDLLLLSRLAVYDPDQIVWLITLESFPPDKQLFPPLVQNNAPAVRGLIAQYALSLNPHDPQLVNPSLWDRTLIGQRRPLADLLRLQLYGFLWAATGIDQDLPADYPPRAEDLAADESFHGLTPPHTLTTTDLAFDVLAAGVQAAGDTPLLLVNEPMFVSAGQNSDLRYNFFYPRWAYDAYRVLLAQAADAHAWRYLDLWDAVANTEYTDSPIHLTPLGESQLAARLGSAVLAVAADQP